MLYLFIFTDPPILTLLPRQSPFYAVVNQQVLLQCSATGFPLPEVQWLRNGIAATAATKGKAFVTVQTHYPHTSVYKCVGKNTVVDKEHKQSSSISVIIGGMPLHKTSFSEISCGALQI